MVSQPVTAQVAVILVIIPTVQEVVSLEEVITTVRGVATDQPTAVHLAVRAILIRAAAADPSVVDRAVVVHPLLHPAVAQAAEVQQVVVVTNQSL